MKGTGIIWILLGLSGMLYGQTYSEYQYPESDEVFNNPERGFYKYTARGNASEPLSGETLAGFRENGYTMIYRIYYLSEFVESPVSANYIDRIREDFKTIREEGIKVVLRFAYTSKSTKPYGDATPEQVHQHIAQLKPLMQENADVIAVLQAGFIGAWGEWYYTDHFATGTPANVTEEDLLERAEVVYALLDALPVNRQVQLRTPQHKYRIFGDTPLTEEEAYDGTDDSRTGHHNDCFVSSNNDVGTYVSAGDRSYLEEDSKYTSMGGETCRWFQPRSNCDTAMMEMDRYNWSYLNIDYYGETIQHWKDEGCFDDIQRLLGYRYRMISGEFLDEARPGGSFKGSFEMVNEGFANPMNQRSMEVVLRHRSSGSEYALPLKLDLRKYPKGEAINIEFEGGMGEAMPAGAYDLYLNLPDPMLSLRNRPGFSIRLANGDTWEASSGYNSLQHVLLIDPGAPGEDYQGSDFFVRLDAGSLPVYYQIIPDGDAGDWHGIPELHTEPGNSHAKSFSVYNDSSFLYGLVEGVSLRENHQWFLDTDHNAATGMQFWNWSTGGMDLLVENGIVYTYAGTDGSTEWTWTEAGTAIMAGSSSVHELAVSKDLLPALGDSLALGYRNGNDGYTVTESVPASGGTLVTYVWDMYLEPGPEIYVTGFASNAVLWWGLIENDNRLRVIERAHGAGGEFEIIALLSPTVVSYQDANLVPGEVYRYRSFLTDQVIATPRTVERAITTSEDLFRYTTIEVDGDDEDWDAVRPLYAIYRDPGTTSLRLFGDTGRINILLQDLPAGYFRLYLDTDMQAGTGSGPGIWEGEGFEAMISHDSLFLFNDTWEFNRKLDMYEVSGGQVECSVPIRDLGLGDQEEVGWGVVAGIPGKQVVLPFAGDLVVAFTRTLPLDAPESFRVDQSAVSFSSRLIVGWTKNTEVGGYFLERSVGDEDHFELLSELGNKEYRYIDDNLEPLTEYYYRLRGYNAAGPSPFTSVEMGFTAGVGVRNFDHMEGIGIFPNPASDILMVRSSNPAVRLASARILDASGRIQMEVYGDLISFPVHRLEPGIYLVQVFHNGGVVNSRFIRQ